MKIFKFTLFVVALMIGVTPIKAQDMSEYDLNAPMGWGTVDGEITGSEDENPILITNYDDLVSNLKGTQKRTLYIQGEIEVPGRIALSNARNMTIYGLPGSALVNSTHTDVVANTGILSFSSNSKNVIIRNVTFKSAGAYDIDGYDNLNLTGCTYFWIDHCDFQDGVDGNFDCNNASDNICVSWCRFHYLISPWAGGSGGANDHRYSCLWGGGDSNTSDKGKLNTTFYSCWWDEGCRERMPRVRYGKVHLLDCLYTCTNNSYCIGTGYASNIYVENCISVNGVKAFWKNYATSGSYTDYNITIVGSVGTDNNGHDVSEGIQSSSGNNEFFIPSEYYEYLPYASELVETEVSSYAGATLDIKLPEDVTRIGSINASNSVVEAEEYYSLSGMKLSEPQKGVNIVKQKLSDGSKTSVKTIVK